MLDWAVPLLVVLVAAHQRWRVYSSRQCPWKGGGFGMFSDIDRCSIAPYAWAPDPSGCMQRLLIDAPASSLRSTAARMPAPANIERWALELMTCKWSQCGNVAHVASPHGGGGLELEKLTLHELVVDFDSYAGAYTASELKVHTFLIRR